MASLGGVVLVVRKNADALVRLGHKRTYAVQKGMSALPPKADMCGATRDVRFGPIADIGSLNRLFRSARYYQAEHVGPGHVTNL